MSRLQWFWIPTKLTVWIQRAKLGFSEPPLKLSLSEIWHCAYWPCNLYTPVHLGYQRENMDSSENKLGSTVQKPSLLSLWGLKSELLHDLGSAWTRSRPTSYFLLRPPLTLLELTFTLCTFWSSSLTSTEVANRVCKLIKTMNLSSLALALSDNWIFFPTSCQLKSNNSRAWTFCELCYMSYNFTDFD